jgi:hypothetical protein
MNKDLHHGRDDQEKDPVWDILSADAVNRPVTPSPWFVTRTVAHARTRGQWNMRSLLFRWMMPLPLAGLAALAFLVLQGIDINGLGKGGFYVSSDSDFEDHMELMSAETDLFHG